MADEQGNLRTKDKFHSGGLISLERSFFSKLLNILLVTLSAARSLPVKVKAWSTPMWPIKQISSFKKKFTVFQS